MRTEDGLVVAIAHLDSATRHLDQVSSAMSAHVAHGGEAAERHLAWLPERPAIVVLERARDYIRAAQDTIDDIAGDVARGSVDRVGDELRLVERLCAMADEMTGQLARRLAAAPQDPTTLEDQVRTVPADVSSLRQVRSSVQAAGRVAAELATHLQRGNRGVCDGPDPAATGRTAKPSPIEQSGQRDRRTSLAARLDPLALRGRARHSLAQRQSSEPGYAPSGC